MINNDPISLCLVEDEISVIEAVREHFPLGGAIQLSVEHIVHADDLLELPDRLIRNGYHVLLVDLGLPSAYPLDRRWQAGLDLLTTLEEKKCRSVPVIFTAYDDDTNRIMGARLGAQVLLAKKERKMWDTLTLHIQTAYAYWLALESQRREQAAVLNLAARLAHDLKGPLTVFRGYIHFLRLGPAGMTQNQFLAVDQAVDDAASIASFLEHSLGKNDVQAAKPKPKSTQWPEVFDQIGRMAQLMNREHDLVARLSFLNSFDGALFIDDLFVKRAVNNLVINSLAAMRKQGRKEGEGIFRAECFAEVAWLTLILNDNAGGLDANAFEHSSGFGLGICKQIVELHGGRMPPPVLNSIGGTTFTLQFPLTGNEA